MKYSLKRISKQLWSLGIIDGLTNISATMIFTISGPFMKDVLKSGSIAIGALEGLVELISWVVRLFSGVISDYFKKRKALMVVGYLLIIVSRPILALATDIYGLFLGRSIDRIGKGVQASPREALVADISPQDLKGSYFGLKHALGIAGSVIGAFIVLYMMKITGNDYRLIFWVSLIPALVALFCLILSVYERDRANVIPASTSLTSRDFFALGKEYWFIVIISIFFMLCRSSEVFITLRALEVGMAIELISLVMIAYNFSETLISYPIGLLSDVIGRRACIGIAILFLTLANFVIGTAGSNWMIIIGSILWGVQRGISHSVFLSWVADSSSIDLRATSYGVFYLVGGFSLFLTNLISGLVVNYTDYKTLYIGHALLGCIPLLSLIIFKKT